jgi:hypothetical protein
MKLFKAILLVAAFISIAGMAWIRLCVLVINKLFAKPVLRQHPTRQDELAI